MNKSSLVDIVRYIFILFISIVYFYIIFYDYFTCPFLYSGAIIDYTILSIIFVLPLIILYIIGLFLTIVQKEAKRESVGWLIASYSILYLSFIIFVNITYIATAGVSGDIQNGVHSLMYIAYVEFILSNIMIAWYIFLAPLLYKYNLKNQLKVVGIFFIVTMFAIVVNGILLACT